MAKLAALAVRAGAVPLLLLAAAAAGACPVAPAWAAVIRTGPAGPAGFSTSGYLGGVAATSASSAWAVGARADADGNSKPVILRWNGTAWKQVPSPDLGPPVPAGLDGVAATSADSAWAVGGLS